MKKILSVILVCVMLSGCGYSSYTKITALAKAKKIKSLAPQAPGVLKNPDAKVLVERWMTLAIGMTKKAIQAMSHDEKK